MSSVSCYNRKWSLLQRIVVLLQRKVVFASDVAILSIVWHRFVLSARLMVEVDEA